MPRLPALCRLADRLVDDGISSFIASRRDERRSWDGIARDLHTATSGEIDTTGPTIADWAGRLGLNPPAEAAS